MRKTIIITLMLLAGMGVMAQGEAVSWKKNLQLRNEKLRICVDGYGGYVNIWQDTADFIEVVWCNASDTALLDSCGMYVIHDLGTAITYLNIQAFSGYGSICVHTTKKDLKIQSEGICRVDIIPTKQMGHEFKNLTIEAEEQSLVNVTSIFKCSESVSIKAKDNAMVTYYTYEAPKHEEQISEHGIIKGTRK